jgi:hypothetical protein
MKEMTRQVGSDRSDRFRFCQRMEIPKKHGIEMGTSPKHGQILEQIWVEVCRIVLGEDFLTRKVLILRRFGREIRTNFWI